MNNKQTNTPLLIVLVLIICIMLIFTVITFNEPSNDSMKDEVPVNKRPIAIVDTPIEHQVFSINDEIFFSAAYCSDPEGEELSYDWISDIDGHLSTKDTFSTYLDAGAHEITLTVVDEYGLESYETINITIYPDPVAVIGDTIEPGKHYITEQFLFDGSNSSSDYSNTINCTWSSDLDGVLGYDAKARTSLSKGYHIITLVVDDGLGVDEDQLSIEVFENQEPFVEIRSPSYNEIFQVDSEISFDASSSYDPDMHKLAYDWTSNLIGHISNKATFARKLSAGTHIITLTLEDEYGSSSETSTVITVNTPPVADAGNNRSVIQDESVIFDATNSYDADNDELNYLWDFGDGNKDMGITVNHIYRTEGNFLVTLTVQDNHGGVDYDSIEIGVKYVFKGTGVYGYVYDSMTKKPLETARLWLSGEDWNDTESNESGYYEFHALSGEYYFRCEKDDEYYRYSTDLEIVDGQAIELNIYLVPFPPETAIISGYVYDNETKEPIYDADISIYDGEGYYNDTYSDPNGYYEINVPALDLILSCWVWSYGNEIEYEDYFIELSISDYENLRLDIYLLRYHPSEFNYTFEFSTWDYITFILEEIQYSSTSSLRHYIDLDDNGEVTEDEVTGFEEFQEMLFEDYNSDFNTENLLTVDDIYYLYVAGSIVIQIENAEGSVYSNEPITWTYTLNLRSNQTIPISNAHELALKVHYDDSYGLYEYYIVLPSFFIMTNYTASENVNVTGDNSDSISIDPNDYDDSSEWIMIEVIRTF